MRNNIAAQPELNHHAKKRKGSHHPAMELVRESFLVEVSHGGGNDGNEEGKGACLGEGMTLAKVQK